MQRCLQKCLVQVQGARTGIAATPIHGSETLALQRDGRVSGSPSHSQRLAHLLQTRIGVLKISSATLDQR
jgi:hypothetical protein